MAISRDPYEPGTGPPGRTTPNLPYYRRRSSWGWGFGVLIILILVVWWAWAWGWGWGGGWWGWNSADRVTESTVPSQAPATGTQAPAVPAAPAPAAPATRP